MTEATRGRARADLNDLIRALMNEPAGQARSDAYQLLLSAWADAPPSATRKAPHQDCGTPS